VRDSKESRRTPSASVGGVLLLEDVPAYGRRLLVTGQGREMFDLTCAHDLEGIIAKRLADPYHTRVSG